MNYVFVNFYIFYSAHFCSRASKCALQATQPENLVMTSAYVVHALYRLWD